MKRKGISLAVIGCIVLSAVSLNVGCVAASNKIYVAPTCNESGYTIYRKNGRTDFREIIPATGHSFGEWIVTGEPEYDKKGSKERICKMCGAVEREFIYKTGELSQIRFEGSLEGIGKKSQVTMSVSFIGNNIDFQGYATLKHQGHSSLIYDKKNFTVKFYEDETFGIKKKFQFMDWNKEHKYILKANYLDLSRSRNLICSDIWSEIVESREIVHSRLKGTSNYGAVDGFPVEVYINGEFIGLYNLTLHKDDGLFSMEDGREDCIMIANTGSAPAVLFNQQVNWESEVEDWEVEYCGLDDSTKFKNRLNELIDFVMNSSDDEFQARLSEYVDVDSLIDYLIAVYALGLNYNLSKDLVLVSYDNGPWIASLFDMETAFGLHQEGNGFFDVSSSLPSYDGEKWNSGGESLLWNRMMYLFYDEICERYSELRGASLSKDNLFATIERRVSAIPEEANKSDVKLYGGQPVSNASQIEQMTNYAKERLNKLDEIFDYSQEGAEK